MNDFNHHERFDLKQAQKEFLSLGPTEPKVDPAGLFRELHGDDYAEHQAKRDEMWERVKVALMIFVLGVAFIAGVITAARGADNGQIPPDVPDHIRQWFKGVRSPNGVICCNIADGHRTDYDQRPDGYWVPIKGEWRHVPPEAVVLNAGNPVGEAVVWYQQQGANTYYIRCFVPGGGV